MVENTKSLYTLPFLLLCLSHMLFGGSFSMIIPELPSYLSSLGGDEYKGLIIALFTLSAGFSRPFSGKLADSIGRVPVMVFGTLVCVVCSLLYPLISSVAGFLMLRFFHGFSTGFKPTAATAFAADIIPVDRRGEAMGILGISLNIGVSAFPPVGSWLVINYSMDAMFYVSSAAALVSILMLMGLKETLEDKQKFTLSLLKIAPSEVIESKVLPPSIVILFLYMTLGALLTITPDQSDFLGLKNKGMIFTSLTVFAILSRFFAGRISDKHGRVVVIKFSIFLVILTLIFMGTVSTSTQLLMAAGAIGFSTGVAAPAIFAWVIDLSPEGRMARSMATAYIALEIGIGSGALLSAYLYDNNPENFGFAFYVLAGLTLLSGIYLQFIYKPSVTVKEK